MRNRRSHVACSHSAVRNLFLVFFSLAVCNLGLFAAGAAVNEGEAAASPESATSGRKVEGEVRRPGLLRPQPSAVPPSARGRASAFEFIENRGQWMPEVRFLARQGALAASLEKTGVKLGLSEGPAAQITLSFEGATADVKLEGEGRRDGRYNFFLGNDPDRWRSDVTTYSSVIYRGLYRGVDMRVREGRGLLEYDLLLDAGVNADEIIINVGGASKLETADDGALIVEAEGWMLRQTPPITWEVLPGGEKRPVECRFRVIDAQRYGFEVERRDDSLPLVIDPGLEWSTYVGGGGQDEVYDVAAVNDGSGDVIVAGTTMSPDFSGRTGVAGFVARFGAGGHLIYKTILGGSDREWIRALAVSATGEAVVVGESYSPDYPTTPGAYDTTHGFGLDGRPGADAFVTRLDATGATMIFSTFIGTNDYEQALAVALAPSGAVIVAGETTSASWPTTPGAYDRTHNCCTSFGSGTFSLRDAWVARLSANGSALEYSTYFGGHGDEIPTSIVVDSQGFVTFTGLTYSPPSGGPPMPTTTGALRTTPASDSFSADAFLVRMKLDGGGAADLRYSTFLGGNDTDEGYAVALDPTNPSAVIVGGVTRSTVSAIRFPTTVGTLKPSSNSVDGFVMKFAFPSTGASLVWSTFFGGFMYDEVSSLAVDASGVIVIAGQTHSFDLPATQGAYDRSVGISSGLLFFDAYAARLSGDGSRVLYCTYLGGSHDDWNVKLALTGQNSAFVAGWTQSADFPAGSAAFDPVLNNDGIPGPASATDAFLARLTLLADDDGDDIVSAPVLISPASGASVSINSIINFDWSDVSDPSGIDGYHIQLNRRSDFVCCDDWQEVWTRNSEWIATVRFDGTYYWRVQTADRSGNLSEWSEVRTLNAGTPQPPAAPVPQSPANGTRLPPNTAITFTWSATPNATSYEIQIDDSDRFTAPLVVSQSGLTSTQSVHSFSAERRQWWRVRARNSTGTFGAWSSVWSFEIKRGAPPPSGPAALSTLTLSPSTVTGGGSSQGTVTLTAAAPSGGAVITLASSNAGVASVPASVTVPAGATGASFNVSTVAVTTSTSSTISASYNGVTRTALLTVQPVQSVALSTLSLNPTSVTGGAQSQGTVTLTGAAPSGGAFIALSSSNAGVASVPASVTVPAGATSTTFNVSTASVASTTSVTISAAYNGVTRTATITVNAAQATDTVSIQMAEYDASKRELRVEATSTSATATLRCYVTSTGELIGTLSNSGGGRYKGQFSRPANPQNITIRSSLGGAATRTVTAK